MTTFLQSQIFFVSEPNLVISAIKFVGLGFYISLLVLWTLLQGLVWLAARYSRLISRVHWWRSGVLAFFCTMTMIVAWSFPFVFAEAEEDDVILAMTSSMVCGAIVAWFLCGRLYRFEFIHRVIVSVGVAIFVLFAMEIGRIIQWKFLGG